MFIFRKCPNNIYHSIIPKEVLAMKKVELRSMEQTKYEIIKNLVDNNGNKHRAAIKLDITIRQVNRFKSMCISVMNDTCFNKRSRITFNLLVNSFLITYYIVLRHYYMLQ